MAAEKLDTYIRKEQIAEAVLALVASHGVKALSMARVARRVGLVPSAIYRHFASKEEMLDTAIDHIEAKLLGNVQAVSQESLDPLERLRGLLVRHVRLIRENQGIPRIIFSQDVYSGRPERKIRVHHMIRGYLRQVGEIVQQGQQRGQIRPDIDADSVSVMFLGMIQPAAILWHLSDGGFDVTRHAERAWKIFSQAIQSPCAGGTGNTPAGDAGVKKEK